MDRGRFNRVKAWCKKNIKSFEDDDYSSKKGITVYPNVIVLNATSTKEKMQVARKHFELIYESILLLRFIDQTDEELKEELRFVEMYEENISNKELKGDQLTKVTKNLRKRLVSLVKSESLATKQLQKAKELPSTLFSIGNKNVLEATLSGWSIIVQDAKKELDRLTNQIVQSSKSHTSNKSKGGPSHQSYYEIPNYRNPFIESYFPIFNTPTAPFSVFATYRFRQTKLKGNFEINLNKVSADTRFMRFDENIGNLKDRCENCFKIVSLDEMEMTKQREILFILDGSILSNFKKFVNSASITMIKEHSNGKTDFESTNITYTNFKQTGNVSKMVYGWQENDTNPWKDYKYKVSWNFFQNYSFEEEYEGDADVITISPPVSLKTVSIEADSDFVQDNNIKYITINLSYKYGNRIQTGYVDLDDGGNFTSKPIRLQADGILSKNIGLILPNDSNEFTYTYKVTTYDGESYRSKQLKSNGLIIDEIHKIPTNE